MAQEFLSSMLPRRGPTAFERFMAALVNCEQQRFIAETLEPEMAKRIKSTQAAEGDTDDIDAARFMSQNSQTDEEIIKAVKGRVSLLTYVVKIKDIC